MASATTVDVLLTFLGDVQKIRYSEYKHLGVASSTIIIFDHLITLNQEYELIWSSPWSFGKWLFLINRYYTLLSVVFNNYALFSPTITDSFCLSWHIWQGWTGVISFLIAELILQLRLYALYLLDKRVLIFMAMSSLLATASSAAVMGSVLSKITATAHPFPGYRFCVAYGISDYSYAFWIPMLASESVFCGLAVFRFMQNWRSSSTLFQTGKHLLESLIRDSVFYFLVMFATYLTNAIVFIVGTSSEIEIPIGFAVALSCVMGNRLCLNVRGMIRDNRDIPTLSEVQAPPSIGAMPVWHVDGVSELSLCEEDLMEEEAEYRDTRWRSDAVQAV